MINLRDFWRVSHLLLLQASAAAAAAAAALIGTHSIRQSDFLARGDRANGLLDFREDEVLKVTAELFYSLMVLFCLASSALFLGGCCCCFSRSHFVYRGAFVRVLVLFLELDDFESAASCIV